MSFAAVIGAIEVISSLVMVEQQIEIQVIKAKIKSVVEQHRDQFNIITEINKIFTSLKNQSILIGSIQQLNSVLLTSWDIIAQNIDEKIKLTQTLTSQFKDITTAKYSFNAQSATLLSLTAVVASHQLYKFLQSNQELKTQSPEASIKKLKGSMIKQPIIVEKIQVTGGENISSKKGSVQFRKDLTQPKGSVQKTSSFQVSQNIDEALQAPSKSSAWSKIKNFGSKIGKGLLKGLRAIGFLAMLAGVYFGSVAIETLLIELKNMINQYGENGNFKIAQIQIINLIMTFGQMVSNLSYASYASLQMICNSYVMMALTFSSLNSICLKRSQQNRPENHGVSIQFCVASNQFYNDLCLIKVDDRSSNQDMKNAIQTCHNVLKNYLDKWAPMDVFSKLAKFISQYTIQTSFFLKGQLVKETVLQDFKSDLSRKFLRRKEKIKKPIQQVKLSDQKLIVQICNSYLSMVEDISGLKNSYNIQKYDDIKQLNATLLEELGNVIVSFTNSIYSQSNDGDMLFDKMLSTYKGIKSYAQILPMTYSLPNTIPIPFSGNQEKEKIIQQFNNLVKIAIKQDLKGSFDIFDQRLYSIISQAPCIFWKQIPNKITVKDQKYTKMQFQKAMLYKIVDKKINRQKLIIFVERKPYWKIIYDDGKTLNEQANIKKVETQPVYRYYVQQEDRRRYQYSLNPKLPKGWTLEGVAFEVPRKDDPLAVPIYEFYCENPDGRRFLYELTKQTRIGWIYDGSAFSVYTKGHNQSVPIHKFCAVYKEKPRFMYSTASDPIGKEWKYVSVAFWAFKGQKL